MKDLLFKTSKAVIKDVDMSSRTVTGYFNSFGVIDSDRQMSMQGAFAKTVMENGPKGSGRIAHVSSHRLLPEFLLSRPKVLEEDNFGLYFESEIVPTTHGNDILMLYDKGLIREHSCMVVPVKTTQKNGYEEVNEWALIEGSTVVFGSNASTPFLGMKSAFAEKGELLQYQKDLFSAYRTGTFSDDFFPHIEHAINTITHLIGEFEEQKPPQDTSVKSISLETIIKELHTSFINSK